MKAYIISQFFKIENVNIRKEISMTLTCVNKYISIMQITSTHLDNWEKPGPV